MCRESFLGEWPAAVENVLQRKSPCGVITRNKREVVLPLHNWVNLVEFSTEAVGSPAERNAMTARAWALEKQARKLPATERERLAERLLVRMKHEPHTAVNEV